MLPERAFQPRGPYGMTLEGGGGGIIGDIVEGVGNIVGDVVETVGDVAGDVIEFVDERVIQPVLDDPVSAVATVIGAVIGGPPGAGIANTIAGLSQGESPREAVQGGLQTAGAMYLIGSPGGSPFGGAESATGTEGFAQFSDEIYQGASGTVPSAAAAAPPIDYSLIGGSTLPPGAEGMGGGTGITPGASGAGLQQPTMPNIAGMGGGQGLTVPVDGGTVGQLGFTPAGAVPVLGSPSSFINNPEVIGQPVLAQGTPATLSIGDALRGARLVNSLLNQPQQQQSAQDIGQPMSATGVDYSQLLGLLSQRARGTGLLGTQFQPQPINLVSLLG